VSSTGPDAAARERFQRSQQRSVVRREGARRRRRKLFRLRGSVVSLVAVALVTAVAGVTIATAKPVVVKNGDRGPAVVRIQKKLHIQADGVFGKLTKRAVKRFQRRKGLDADGVVGPQTRRAMRLKPFSRSSVHRRKRRRGSDDSGGSGVKLPRVLRRIAECESGGNPTAVSPGGRHRGKYQFSRSTWKNIGGEGDPAEAPEAEQDRRALKLYRRSGTAPWPNCA
jgi:hypothetical protein